MPLQRNFLLSAFHAALAAADPQNLLPTHLPSPPARGRTLVVGGGKAAATMAQAVEKLWPAEAPLSGLVVTRYQHGLPLTRIRVIEASHPLPDGRGAEAASRMLEEIAELTPDDLLLVLISGGGSSLLALPVEGVTLKELRAVTKSLLACGASIREINTVRKHLTRFSGGQVAALSKAPVRALILSDVVGDDPTYIASGPCAPDPDTFSDALALLQRYAIMPPAAVNDHLQRGLRGDIADTPKPGDPRFAKVENRIIGSAHTSLSAVQTWLQQQGVRVINLWEEEGESRRVANAHAERIRLEARRGSLPFALLSGGETTVTVRNANGRGGRNTEYLLALGLALRDLDRICAIACDTDGIDGTEDNAGAVWTPDTLARAESAGLDAAALLEANDAYGFFSVLNDLVITGPTRTNVNDFRMALVY
ncbi:MAG: glycerate kinase [Pseudomonadota bacterium]